MESTDFHHQEQLQDQLLIGSSSLASPSRHGIGSNHGWTPNIFVNTTNFNPNSNGVPLRFPTVRNDILVSPLDSSLVPDLGFHWAGTNAGSFTTQSARDLHLAKIKEEQQNSFPKFSEMINCPANLVDFRLSPSSGELYSHNAVGIPTRGNFSHIYPSINISNLKNPMDMNLQAIDLLGNGRFCGNLREPSHDNVDLFEERHPFGRDHMKPSSPRLSKSPSSKIAWPFRNEGAEAKKASSTTQASTKKPRLESRASCPPFKVRKEKLGDRIAALQQLVAPFGKTDTASVLMEAIGYIKFLHNQVETLSVPYMNSSCSKTCRTIQRGILEENETAETKRDLRSRGLCLVPLSCMSYLTDDGGSSGGVWPPPSFGGGC